MLPISLAIILTGVLVAVNAALVGTFLVVRGQAMVTDAISHGILPGIAVSVAISGVVSSPFTLFAAGLSGILTVLLIDWLTRRGVQRDSATGLVFPAFFALGILIFSRAAPHVRFDVNSVLFGEIGFVWVANTTVFGVTLPTTLWPLIVMLFVNAIFAWCCYRPLVSGAFDVEYALLQRFAPRTVATVLLILTSITAVAAFEAVGAILFMAFAIVPAVTGVLLFRRMSAVLVFAAASSGVAALVGYPLATWLNSTLSGMMALVTAVPLLIAIVITWQRQTR